MRKIMRSNAVTLRRILATVLSIAMVVSYLPINAAAAELEPEDEAITMASTEASVDVATEEVSEIEEADVPDAGDGEDADHADADPADDGAGDDAAPEEGGTPAPEEVEPAPAEEEYVPAEDPEAEEAAPEEGEGVSVDSDLPLVQDGEPEVGTGKYNLSLTASDRVRCDEISFYCLFYDEDDNQLGETVSLCIQPNKTDNVYTASTEVGGVYLPKGTAEVAIEVESGWINEIDYSDLSRFYIKVNGDSIFGEDCTAEDVAFKLQNGGYLISNLTDASNLDIAIYLVPTIDEGDRSGLYRVKVQRGDGIPFDVTPTVNVKFDTSDSMSFSEDMPDWAEYPKRGEDLPSSVTVSIPDDFLDYLDKGCIELGHSTGERDYYYFTDEVKDPDNTDHSYTLSDLSSDYSVLISVEFSNVATMYWSYEYEDRHTDYYLSHCKAYLLDGDGNDMDVDNTYCSYSLICGQQYQIRIVPDKGYQLRDNVIDGYRLTAVDGKPGVFEFTMEKRDFRLSNVVEKVGNLARIDSSVVGRLMINDREIGEFKPEAPEGSEKDFDGNMGGSIVLSVADGDAPLEYKTAPGASDEVKNMVADATIDFSIDQAVAKSAFSEDPEYWEKKSVITDLTEAVRISFVYPGDSNSTYKVAALKNGSVIILDAEYRDNMISFDTDVISTFTIIRNTNSSDDVVFDLTLSDNLVGEGYALTPLPGGGLVKVDTGDPSSKLYKYTSGDIRIKVTKGGDHPIPDEELWAIRRGWYDRFSIILKTGAKDQWGNDEELWFFAEQVEGSTVYTIPVMWDDYDHPFPIKDMMQNAANAAGGNTPVITTNLGWRGDSLKKQVEFTDADLVTYTFGEGSNVYSATYIDEDEKQYDYFFIDDGDCIEFTATAISGAAVTGVTYQVIESCFDYETDSGEQWNELCPKYPSGSAESLGDNRFRIPVPVPASYEPERKLGLRLTSLLQENTEVAVVFPGDGENYEFHNNGQERHYDISIRTDSMTYPVNYKNEGNNSVASTLIPADETAYITVVSTDGCNEITKLTVNGTELKQNKNKEFVLAPTGAAKVSLTPTIKELLKLWVVDDDGEELVPEKGKYNLNHLTSFTVFLSCGSDFIVQHGKGVSAPKQVSAVFKNGSKQISTGYELTTTGKEQGCEGKTLPLNVSNSGYGFSKTIQLVFTQSATSVKVAGADRNNVITIPFGAYKNYKVTLSKGADASDVKAKIIKVNDAAYDDNDEVISYDGTHLYVDGNGVTDNLQPNDEALVEFRSVLENRAIGTVTIKFANVIAGKKPSIKPNAALTTHHEIGLNLSLPSGVQATDNMYYKIVATADKIIFDPDDPSNNNLSRWDEESHSFVQIYREEIYEFIQASNKTAAIYVMEYSGADIEEGKCVEYSVTATLVYAAYEDQLYTKGESSLTSDAQKVSTKDVCYETKLTLKKKAPAKIYSGQKDVLVAEPKWSATTTVKEYDRIRLLNPYGDSVGEWFRNDQSYDNHRYNVYVNIGGGISISTVREDEWQDEDGDYHTDTIFMEPGKYTIEATAMGGAGIFSTATVTFQVVDGITGIGLNNPETVYKAPGKKATFKAELTLHGPDGRTPASKKVIWDVIQGLDEEGSPIYFDDDEEGSKISIKNGTVTIAPGYKVSSVPADNTFMICAWANDYEDNNLFVCSRPITVTSVAQVPTRIMFRWWHEEINGWQYSDIIEEKIAAGEIFVSNQINFSNVVVYDQFNNEMQADIKVAGLGYEKWNNTIKVIKAGKATVTATAREKKKKAKKLAFTISNTDYNYNLNTLIQNADGGFINLVEGPGMKGGYVATNDYSGNCPFYVNVAGIRVSDSYVDEDKVIHIDPRPEADYGDNALIAHSISIKGGKIAATMYGQFEHYATYKVIPTAAITTITIQDKTKLPEGVMTIRRDKYEYTVNNTSFGEAKAYSITANRKNIYYKLWADANMFAADESDVPNKVKYTVKNAPVASAGNKLRVRITMDDGDGKQHNIARVLGLFQDGHGFNAYGTFVDLENGVFTLDYYDHDTYASPGNTMLSFGDTPAGTYTLYATIGEVPTAGSDEDFTPLAKMTKISLKVVAPPKATAKFASSKLVFGAASTLKLEIPPVNNGLGISYRVWWNDNDDRYDSDVFYTLSTNVKGRTNYFINMFEIVNPAGTAEGDFVLKPDAPDAKKPVFRTRQFHADIEVAKDCPIAMIDGSECWGQLLYLKNGDFKINPDTGRFDPNGELIGTANQQKAAYKKWVKENCTGYIGYKTVDYTGSGTQSYLKVTVDIEGYLNSLPY